ncbi:MAG: Sensor protein FixL [Dehalococcoidia bacterium]|nr:Sensor protein FixL [Chloroflexota bacterium]
MNKRAFAVGILTLVACAATVYFHGMGVEAVFPHLYYLPIILAAIWWERRSWFLTAFLCAFLLASHVISGLEMPITSNLARAASFLLVGGVAVELSRGRRRAQEALWASYRQAAAILVSMLDAVVVADPDGAIRTLNRAALELLGYTEEELVGQPVGTIFEEEEEEEEEESFFMGTGMATLVREGAARDVEMTLRTKSGERIPAILNGSVIRERDGRLSAVVGVARDIRERKWAEETLRKSEEKYRNLIDQSQDAIYLLHEGRFELINQRFEELLGYTLEETNSSGFDFMNLVAPKSRGLVEERSEKVARGETVPPQYEFAALSRDGTEIEAEISVSYINYKGGIAAQGIMRDIRERKWVEMRIDHLNLVLRAIRNVNQLITREKDRDRLLKGVCETLIETRGYHHAWIAMLDESGGLVTSAEAGFGEHFLPLLEHLRRGEPPVCVQRALQQSDVVVMKDAPSVCGDCHLVAQHSGTMAMTVRLVHAGKVYGLLNVSVPASLDGDEEERTLFQEVAGDIALALHSIELEEARRQAEEALRESEEKHRTILENIEEGYYEVDIAGNFTFFNDSLCRILGYPADELMGMNNRQYTDEENARKLYQAFNEVHRTGKPIRVFDWEVIRKDGTKRFVEASVSLVSDPAGQPTGSRGIVRDITERKRAEEALQEAHDTLEMRVQERTADLARTNEALRVEITERKRAERQVEEHREYLASVLRHAPDAIVSVDTSNRIVEWNPGAERLLGYSRDEAQGKNIDDLIARPDVEEQFRFFTSEALSGKGMPPTEVVHYRENGEPVNVIVSTSPIMIGDQVGGVVVIYTDITQRKRAEDELRVKEMQLIHAGRLSSLGEMATGVAHEINQPLAIISLAAEGRLRDIQSGRFDVSILPQELEDILKNVRRIDRIITHMRTFARHVEEWESVEPEEVLDNVFILLGEQFRIHGISISREIEEGLPCIKVDVNQLEQVFVNILTNARQVLDESAEEAARRGEAFKKRLVCSISRESREEHEYVVFEFADNGYGVPDKLKTRLFDPFFTTKEAGEGTGLGLSIAYSIVTRALGGKIWVEDNEMGGASFKVALPAGGEVRG